MQEQVDTRAIEIATEANVTANNVKGMFETMHTEFKTHEEFDIARFQRVEDKLSDGFRGLYNRLWLICLMLMAGVGTFAITLFNKLPIGIAGP